ncbi:MAG: hypothetical protein LBN27_01170 [Prevotellaceae bacterium]|jgi:hypothetical protein|nr:hypothetical protein [Prevotellaceae bacterium]
MKKSLLTMVALSAALASNAEYQRYARDLSEKRQPRKATAAQIAARNHLKEFDIDGEIIYAINYKNALKKKQKKQ